MHPPIYTAAVKINQFNFSGTERVYQFQISLCRCYIVLFIFFTFIGRSIFFIFFVLFILFIFSFFYVLWLFDIIWVGNTHDVARKQRESLIPCLYATYLYCVWLFLKFLLFIDRTRTVQSRERGSFIDLLVIIIIINTRNIDIQCVYSCKRQWISIVQII